MTSTATATTTTQSEEHITSLQHSRPIFSNEELLNYTSLRHEQCWIRDILSMEPYKEQPKEYYMLGRIPCRSVQIVGICVGAQEFEKRWKVTVDDGTGVIDCIYRIEPQSPSKREREPSRSTTLADVGWPLRVTGKVAQWFETRELHNVTIERANYNDEPQHWKQVRHLHDTHYDIDEPFIIPAKPVSSREKERTQHHQHLTPNSTTTTMQTPAVKDPINELPRLRHPSRLHTDQLTDNVLAIYVLHYLHHSWNTFSPSSTSPEKRGYSLSYLRRIPELSLLAQRVVKAEAKRLYRANKQKDSTQRRYRPTGSDLARKMKKLFDNAVIRLMRDGNLVVWQGPVHRAPTAISPVDGPWKTQKSVDLTSVTMSSTMTMTQDDEEVELSEPEDEEEAYAPTSGCLPIVLRQRLFKLRGLNFKDKNVVMTEAILKVLKHDEQWKWIGQWHLEEALKSYDGVYYVRGGWRATG